MKPQKCVYHFFWVSAASLGPVPISVWNHKNIASGKVVAERKVAILIGDEEK